MKISFKIDYYTRWGQNVYICGSIPELGTWDESNALLMSFHGNSKWYGEIEIYDIDSIDYYYFIKDGENISHREWGDNHNILLNITKNYRINDNWQNKPKQQYLYTSAFSDSFFFHEQNTDIKYYNKTILLDINCPYVGKNQELILCGETDIFGNWDTQKALRINVVKSNRWILSIDAEKINLPIAYKLAITDKESKCVVHWEYGENRRLLPFSSDIKDNFIRKESLDFRYGWMNWRAAGVSIPVFSLRSENSWGIGEFSDLRLLIDWVSDTKQRIIQILPVNDTTVNHKWTDSYPYSAISIYALHPIYLGLSDFQLKNKKLLSEYKQKASKLNRKKNIDYEKVLQLKYDYFDDLYNEIGKQTIASDNFISFYENNKDWLFPYAAFSYFRDKNKTADYSKWQNYKNYNKLLLEEYLYSRPAIKKALDKAYFIQYLLHTQLFDIKKYAHSKGVILKGDVPIGISRFSVEAWTEPHLFNLDSQTGAPPDDFSINGQNWGFPTYKWEEMEKDGYQWWIKRFRKMADYFDAYRIDHILGFFRIWEIPSDSVQGLLGYFHPALPYTENEIRNYGLDFNEDMLEPHINEIYLDDFFEDYKEFAIENYLKPDGESKYKLKEFCNTQKKVEELFKGKNDDKNIRLKNGLYKLCNEVLFIRDKREPEKFHPRIIAQYTHSHKDLNDRNKSSFNRLYNQFFYHRHSIFWRNQAIKKLSPLISSTHMLVCGEDLGMIPECVPSVMNDLQILSLEVQRMPKINDIMFENLNTIPYLSVCTTSTHDMAPIREWWRENPDIIQHYYNEILWREGVAPDDCTADICYQIIDNHLHSPAMLAIFPWQDWISIDKKLRRKNPGEERINIPAIPQHYWKYRMHITLEKLLKSTVLNEKIVALIKNSGR